jgi:hypothetical protein
MWNNLTKNKHVAFSVHPAFVKVKLMLVLHVETKLSLCRKSERRIVSGEERKKEVVL